MPNRAAVAGAERVVSPGLVGRSQELDLLASVVAASPAVVPWSRTGRPSLAGVTRSGVTVDSSVLLQPGTYAASLAIRENTPYPTPHVDVSFDVTPPRNWGRLAGLVQGVGCDGTPAALPDATVQVNGRVDSWTLLTGGDGRFAYWIDTRENPLSLIVAKDAYELEVRDVRLQAGRTVTADVDLARAAC